MRSEDIQRLKNGAVVFVNYPNDNPNEPNKYKPRPVVLLDNWSQIYCTVICITDIENITTQKGIPVLANSDEGKAMRLTKDSFINFDDCKTNPTLSFIKFRGYCPETLFKKILDANL